MNINAASGDLVTFQYPDAGLYVDQAQCRQMLTLNGVYTVNRTDVHGFVTYVYLQEFPDHFFNSVMFEDVLPPQDFYPSQEALSPQDLYPSQDAILYEEPVHEWFGLSYASYLTLPRSLLEAMPLEWQKQLTALLREMEREFPVCWPLDGNYRISLVGADGRFQKDALSEYRRPDAFLIESLRRKNGNEERT